MEGLRKAKGNMDYRRSRRISKCGSAGYTLFMYQSWVLSQAGALTCVDVEGRGPGDQVFCISCQEPLGAQCCICKPV